MKRQSTKYLNQDEKRKLLAILADRKSAARSYMMYHLMLNTGPRCGFDEKEGLEQIALIP